MCLNNSWLLLQSKSLPGIDLFRHIKEICLFIKYMYLEKWGISKHSISFYVIKTLDLQILISFFTNFTILTLSPPLSTKVQCRSQRRILTEVRDTYGRGVFPLSMEGGGPPRIFSNEMNVVIASSEIGRASCRERV